MNYNIQSKPTIYKGTKYRSRLEARWAAFFDLLKWRYQYEPFDLPGWTPDFQVFGSGGRFILFEIKPFIDPSVRDEYFIKITSAIQMDGEDEWNVSPACILACEPCVSEYSESYVSAGFQITPWGTFEVQWKDNQPNAYDYDIGSLIMNFDGLLWNLNGPRKHFVSTGYDSYDWLFARWIEAGELTRFHYA